MGPVRPARRLGHHAEPGGVTACEDGRALGAPAMPGTRIRPAGSTGAHDHRFRAVTVFAMVHDEPHLISVWRWTAPEELPSPLFDPSAQILAAWRPDLGVAHPAAHHLRICASQGGAYNN
ncbi:hypothetical protein ACFYSH_08310 [Streptomyces sp. NPDC005791]|uniref:hypothetical protein n=1 Tax=Streptomyces sp. NPDC005791 TaxID=3364732 RepID=UPI0036A8FBB1